MKILDRINELANKEKVQPLTVAEKQEQHALRQDYLSMIRGQVLTTFSTIKVVDPIGQDVTPDKVYDLPNNTVIFKINICSRGIALKVPTDLINKAHTD